MWWMTRVRLDRYIVIKGRPARVVNVDISSPGKHGHAKARFTAVDIFDGRGSRTCTPQDTTHSFPT
jgi:translation initiation factor 5A